MIIYLLSEYNSIIMVFLLSSYSAVILILMMIDEIDYYFIRIVLLLNILSRCLIISNIYHNDSLYIINK